MNDILWTEKYRPGSLNDYYMSDTQYTIINNWMLALVNNLPDAKPFLILHGTAGIGKTTIAHLILQKYNYEIIECNASDTRSKLQIHDTLGGISKISVCIDDDNNFKKTALILDEIDGVCDIAGVQEILNIVICKTKTKARRTSKAPKAPKAPKVPKEPKVQNKSNTSNPLFTWVCPVICTSNNVKTKPIQLLSKYSIILHLDIPTYNNCSKLIDKIIINENLTTITQHIKDDIIKKANGDYRQLIMLLYQTQIPKQISIHLDTHLDTRLDTYININTTPDHIYFTPLENINYFITHNVSLDTLTYISSGDTTLFFLNFYTNIISIIYEIQNKQPYKNKLFTQKHTDYLLNYYNILYKIYNYISLADIINNKIYINKQWELLQYVDMFSIAIPTTLLYNANIKLKNNRNNTKKNEKLLKEDKQQLFINNFDLYHHTQYNYMACEHAVIKKKLNIDYIKTFETNITNIYYNLTRFQHIQNTSTISNIKPTRKLRKKKHNPGYTNITSNNINTDTNTDIDKNTDIDTNTDIDKNTDTNINIATQHLLYSTIDKTYIKILNKINELLN